MSRPRVTRAGAERATAAALVPSSDDVPALARAAAGCTACPLHLETTPTVFGDGRQEALLMLVGEPPGDQEDKQGRPFVGPAGRVLWSCLEEAGIERSDLYTTNAVKHFKHEDRGARRLHKKPDTSEIEACHPWLAAEVRAVRPKVSVAPGAVAARSLLRRSVAIGASRGVPADVDGHPLVVTYHPSAVLRADERAVEIRSALVADLITASRAARGR